jgi:hypothetical protein
VTPTTKPFNQPFSLRNASHSLSRSTTLLSRSLAFVSNAASLSFFFNLNRALAAVFLRRLSSEADRGVRVEEEKAELDVVGVPGVVTDEGDPSSGESMVTDDLRVRGRFADPKDSSGVESTTGGDWLIGGME